MQLDDRSLDLLYRKARTHNAWLDQTVSDDLLRQIYDLMKWAPTSANSSPARIVFVKSESAKQRLLPAMIPENLEKTRNAPVTVIIAQDYEFYEKLPVLFPHTDARAWFVGNTALIDSTAFRNATLQGAYLILAARALAKVDQTFFSGTQIKSNFLINLGYGDASKLFPRGPRLPFEEAASIL